MKKPGEQMTRAIQKQSIGAVFSRICARSAGMPVPFAATGLVEASESGQGFTIGREYPVLHGGTALDAVLMPVAAGLTFCILVGKYLHHCR
mmetsp:Transcript_26677/g.76547  ORF Transcript_26677/g.76547 Transcript_26677/m.76547 type:complete len:91 (+) Transcript_26677:93-365(+)